MAVAWRRKWQPTPVFLPGQLHGQRSLAATVLGVAGSDTTKQLSLHTRIYSSCSCRRNQMSNIQKCKNSLF